MDRVVPAIWLTYVMPNVGIRAWGRCRETDERLHPGGVPNLLEACEGCFGPKPQGPTRLKKKETIRNSNMKERNSEQLGCPAVTQLGCPAVRCCCCYQPIEGKGT